MKRKKILILILSLALMAVPVYFVGVFAYSNYGMSYNMNGSELLQNNVKEDCSGNSVTGQSLRGYGIRAASGIRFYVRDYDVN